MSMNSNNVLMRLVKDVNTIKASLRRVVSNLPLYDIANENSPPALSTNQNNYNPGNYDILRLNATVDITITGFLGGVKGRFLRVFNVGTGEITIAHQDTGSLPENRVVTSTGFGSIISPNEEFVLYYDSTQQRWRTSYSSSADRISAEVQLLNPQSIGDATYTYISWENIIQDTGGFFTLASPTIFTIPQTGWYNTSLVIVWDANGTNLRECFFHNPITFDTPVWDSRLAVSNARTVITLTATEYKEKGDQIAARVWQNSTAPLNVSVSRAASSAQQIFTKFRIVQL